MRDVQKSRWNVFPAETRASQWDALATHKLEIATMLVFTRNNSPNRRLIDDLMTFERLEQWSTPETQNEVKNYNQSVRSNEEIWLMENMNFKRA